MRRKKDPTLIDDLLKCVDPETAGDPCSDKRWVRSRLRGLSEKLDRRACPTTISRLLRDQKLGLRGHRKLLHTGKVHAGRDEQFRHIARQREAFRETGDPRISVDTKKKELIGQFKNAGQTWRDETVASMTAEYISQADPPHNPRRCAATITVPGCGLMENSTGFSWRCC